ncbi:hypothetical protein PHJA_001598700 [Phtheirospermum japonicum]|uniref:Apple domain-containing protein n=1 Tax=Phtheirospermum japonicum TaxID=374723 RepID=A0A830CEW4_9LAMI|nr:hypothetical protein PHJA_001598700 [Phtheirospermum japonicum]
MARGEWVHNGRCSYKRTTIIVCSVNIVVALYVLHSLYTSLYMFSFTDSQTSFKYTPNQIRKMEESNKIRKASEPTELIELATRLKKRLISEERSVELPQHWKWKLTNEILDSLRSLDAAANATEQREVIESWRKKKLKEAGKLIRGKTLDSTILPEEADAVARALSSDWNDEEVLPGRKLPPECHAELHTDYDGAAVRWGITHPKESAYDCCMSCLVQAKRAKPGEMKCNIWVYCPSETGCYSPDIYEHKNQECWLKFAETPKLNFKGMYPEWYRDAHPNAPVIVPWASGIVSL